MKLKIILRKEMNELHAFELKALKEGETKYVFCHCHGYAEERESTDCGQCKNICGEAGVQNCNYVSAK